MSKLKYILVVCVSALFLHLTPADSVFLQKLEQKLNLYNQTFPQEKVYLQLNKSVFKPDEDLWFKAYVIESIEHKPSSLSTDLTIKLIDKNGEDVFKQVIFVVHSALPAFFIQADLNDSLYQPEEEVRAKIKIWSQDGAPVTSLEFEFTVKIGDNTFKRSKQKTDGEGIALIQVTLPEDLLQHPVTLNIKAKYQKMVETRTILIPTLDSFVNLEFFPEGGNLINGIKTNIAYKAVDRYGNPFDFEGEVINQKEEVISKLKSYHQGMGIFSLTPNTGDAYRVRITDPTGIDKIFTLPKVVQSGMALSVVEATKDFITILVRAVGQTEGEKTVWVGQVQGDIYWTEDVALSDSIVVKIPTKKFPVGVAQFTIFDSAGVPAAERLVFVNRHKIMHIDILTDKKEYDMKEMVELTITVNDEDIIPIPANLCLSILTTNRLYLEKTPNILTTLLLTSELEDKIVHPNFYFEKSSEAETVLEHLLMTQKLRRFNWEKIVEMNENKDLAYLGTGGVSGKIYDKNGKPAENARVWLENTDGKLLETRTNKDGKFKFFSDGTTDLEVQQLKAKTAGGSEKVKIVQVETFTQKLKRFSTLGQVQKIFSDVRLDQYMYSENWADAAVVANAKLIDKSFWSTEKATIEGENMPAWKRQISTLGILQAIKMIKPYRIVGSGIFFRGTSSVNNPKGALIVMDGLKWGYDYRVLFSINPNDVDDIKVHISTPDVQFFETQAVDGVIVITTKRGRKDLSRAERKRLTMNNPVWAPNIQVNNAGEAGLNYFNPDKILSIIGIVEGISDEGKPGRAVFRYSIHKKK